MILYRTRDSKESPWVVEIEGKYYAVPEQPLGELLSKEDLHRYLAALVSANAVEIGTDAFDAPIDHQEVWASGVTYYRSRSARINESQDAGGGDFYDRVYFAERPELFFKAVPSKVAGPGSEVRIRSDAKWSVPEPELVLVINRQGVIVGYTVGNDMSSRDIEGANPLYLPQAKVYDRSCALGPGILIQSYPMSPSTQISMEIIRMGDTVFSEAVALSQMKREPQTLVDFLFREQSFPHGCFLFTGTGIVPPDDFTLASADEIRITIEGIGTLANRVG